MLGGAWLFVVIDIIAVLILAAAMLYGSYLARRAPQGSAVKRAAEEATRKLYHPRDRDAGRPMP
jgi:uncharacterized protein YbjT (DUF2867 family)